MFLLGLLEPYKNQPSGHMLGWELLGEPTSTFNINHNDTNIKTNSKTNTNTHNNIDNNKMNTDTNTPIIIC